MAVLRKQGNLWTLSYLLRTLPQSIATVLLLMAILCAPAIQAVDEPVAYIIEEELPAGSLIGNIVVDSKLNQKYTQAVLNNLRYSYLTQSDNRDLFDLDERTGDISAAVNLDRDVICPKLTLCKISLDVAVQPVEYFEAIKIFITILDLNDNAPAFPQEAMASSLSESTVPGILFPIPTATDNDSPEFGVKRYEFVSDTNKFELQMRNTSDGTVDLHLALKGQLDHEEDNAYEMKVIAWDGGNPPRSGTITINIQVVDINDNSPQFLNASYEARVPEDTRPNTTIIKVTARDPDTGTNGEIEYSFTPRTLRAYGNIFGINRRSGEIYIKQALDYEDTTSYNLGVTAQDKGVDSLPTPTKVIVNVVDINDHAPQITINSLTGSENAEVPENEPAPYFVAHISVYDPDGGKNGQFNCSLDNNYFQLVQLYDTEFKVMAIAVLDREAHALHDIRIKCADMGNPPKRTTAHLMVDVMDANDNTPIFRQETYFATLNENNELGEVVAQVQATDQDAGANGQIRYELHEDGRKYFQIDPKTGVIRANVEFDREETSNLEFRVLASDLGEDSHTATTTVLLTIMDENDEEPRFTLQRFVFNVEENVPINTEVGQVTAVDGDLPPNNQFMFAIVSSDVNNVFALDQKNGVITTLRPLDRETKDVYSMVAMVYSKNRNQRNHTARIVIYVDDENDNAPLIDFPREDNNTVYLSNQVPIGYVVTKISAHDLDYGANQKLMYHLSESSDDGAFHIGESTGEVYVNRKFDGVKEEVHRLVVMVKDNGYPQRISIAHLHIVVNESVPYRPHAGASSSRNSNHVSDIQMIIIICVVLGTVILATLLVVAIVVLKRRESKQNSPKFVHKTEMTFAAATGADTDSCDKLPAAPPHTAPTVPPLTGVGGNKGPDGIYVPKPNPHTVPDVAIAGAGGDHRHHHHHPGGEHEDDEMGSVDGGKVSFEMQSPASTEKDSDSGCCADMSNHEDNGNHLHMNGGPGSILRKGHHPHGHPHQGPSPVGGGPPTARKPPSRQSSFSDWLAQESQNLRQSGHVYRVNNAQKTVRFNEENPGTAGPSSGIHGSIPEEGIPIDNDEVPPPAPPPGPGYQNQVYQNGHSLGGVGAPGGPPLPLYPQHQQSAGGPGKIHFVPSQAYRNYGHIGNDIIPEEPENLQYDLPPPPPPTADWNDGSLV